MTDGDYEAGDADDDADGDGCDYDGTDGDASAASPTAPNRAGTQLAAQTPVTTGCKPEP